MEKEKTYLPSLSPNVGITINYIVVYQITHISFGDTYFILKIELCECRHLVQQLSYCL